MATYEILRDADRVCELTADAASSSCGIPVLRVRLTEDVTRDEAYVEEPIPGDYGPGDVLAYEPGVEPAEPRPVRHIVEAWLSDPNLSPEEREAGERFFAF